jgi:hypothetical protein
MEPVTYQENGKSKQHRLENLGTSVRTERFRNTRWTRVESGAVSAEELVDFTVDPNPTVNAVGQTEYADFLTGLRRLADQPATGTTPPSTFRE